MLADHPLLTLLGRRGRGALLDTLLADPARAWSLRDLARAAGVHAMVASRAVRELAALGAAEAFRPGRAMVVRLRQPSAAVEMLRALAPPDLRAGAARAFAAAYHRPAGARLVRWQHLDEDAADPLVPVRVAVIVPDDEEAAWDAVGPALDGVAAAGWPRPDVTVLVATLLGDDPASRAVRAGTPL